MTLTSNYLQSNLKVPVVGQVILAVGRAALYRFWSLLLLYFNIVHITSRQTELDSSLEGYAASQIVGNSRMILNFSNFTNIDTVAPLSLQVTVIQK